ncbi:MAG: DUF4336 domain-containing protein [Pseudomonadota bacterium]
MIKHIDTNIWTLDGADIVFAGAPMNTRMTIVRLSQGGLWIHSPISLSQEVLDFLSELDAPVVALIVPNKLHYLFVEQWIKAYPSAQVFADAQALDKVGELGAIEVLGETAPASFARDIDQVIFSGSRLFQEVVFFHKTSGSVIFTDLLINLKTSNVPFFSRLFLRFEGVIYPDGGLLRLYRWFTNRREKDRQALRILQSWKPKRLLFCHGEAFEKAPAQLIAQEFGYLEK